MLDLMIGHERIQIGKHFCVSFQRTLRIPDDGQQYPLPPGLGEFGGSWSSESVAGGEDARGGLRAQA